MLAKPMDESERHALVEPIRKQVGGDLSTIPPLRRVAMLQRNADVVLGTDWRGKDDGTLVRKTVGPARRREG